MQLAVCFVRLHDYKRLTPLKSSIEKLNDFWNAVMADPVSHPIADSFIVFLILTSLLITAPIWGSVLFVQVVLYYVECRVVRYRATKSGNAQTYIGKDHEDT
jgi:hypothetical protein